MKTALLCSLLLHAFAAAALALWMFSGLDRSGQEARGAVDIDVGVVALGRPRSSEGAASPKRTENRPTIVPARPPVAVDPGASGAAEGPVRVALDAGDASPRVVSVAEYLQWVKDHNEAPPYPRIARVRGDQGRAIVRVVIGATGSPPEQVEIETTSGSDLLDRVALQAAKAWRYPPFRGADAQAVARITIAIPFKFSLEDR